MRTFEKAPCGRCGGSGRYSWNAMHGDTCYGCGGKGYKLTKAGAEAYAAFLAIARPTLALADLRPGMKLRVRGLGSYHVVEIETIEPDPLNPGMTQVRFVPGGGLGSYGAWPTTTFQVAKTKESHRAAWNAIADMPGIVEAPEKDPAV